MSFFLDGVAWSNAIGIWLSMFFDIILLEKESWSSSSMLKVKIILYIIETNLFDNQLVSAATNCKTMLLLNDK